MSKLTSRQIEALQAARDKGGAIHVRGQRAGGAISRMCDRLALRGLVERHGPHRITEAGRAALKESDS